MIEPVTVLALSELEHDALTELANIGVSRAASRLGEMVGEQVYLSVPEVQIVSRTEAADIVKTGETSQFVAVHQIFEGDVAGRAMLIFPETKSLELVRAVSGDELDLEDIIELEHEALAETGNVVLNACLGTFANELRRNFRISLPEVLRGRSTDLFALVPLSMDGELVMLLQIEFAVKKRDISGFIAVILDMPSMALLKGLLSEYIERATGLTAV